MVVHHPIKPKEEPPQKITREAFLYMESDEEDFAQCGTCWQFDPEQKRCAILGPDFEVDADDSCCLYTKGDPVEGQPMVTRVTPKDAGFVKREVRCENCVYGGKKCELYVMLNKKLPDVFNLNPNIKPRACCNAQTPK